MPWIFKYFWFVCAALMLANLFIMRGRLKLAIERGVATQAEADGVTWWLGVWLVMGPIVVGLIGLAAGWSSPMCAGIMRFDSAPRALISAGNLVLLAAFLWWIWRGAGADVLGRIVPTLAERPSYDKRYSPQKVRLVVTAFLLLSIGGSALSWRTIPADAEQGCSVAPVAG